MNTIRRIVVLNQKGGVGKTTTVANLSASLAKLGKRVLAVDLDPQANLTMHLGIDPENVAHSVYTLMLGETDASQVARETPIEGLYIIPSTIDLAGFEVEFSSANGRQSMLKNALEPLLPDYEFLFIDCPPSLGLLAINALVAANEVFIALQTQFFALQGVSRLLRTCELIQERMNPQLKVTGVIPCMYDPRLSLSKAVLADIRNFFGDKVFKTVIRANTRLAEAPGFGKPILLYDRRCYGSMDYLSLARELLGVPPPMPPPLPGSRVRPPADAAVVLSATGESPGSDVPRPPASAAADEPPPLSSVAPQTVEPAAAKPLAADASRQ